MPEVNLIRNIFGWRKGFNAMFAINMCIKLNIINTLNEKSFSKVEEIANILGLKIKPLKVLLDYGVSIDIFQKKEEKYALTKECEQVLVFDENSINYMGGYVSLGADFAPNDYNRYAEVFQSEKYIPFQKRGDAFFKTVRDAIHGLHNAVSNFILPKILGLESVLNSGLKILDFGCGTGNQIIKIVQKWESSQITGIDIDESSIKIAKNEVKKLGLEDKVKIFNYDDYDKIDHFDLIIMVEVFHEISEDKRLECIKFCNEKLKDNGLLVILDETYPETDEEFKMNEFQFPLQTSIEELFWGNFIPTRSSQESILKNAGFNKVINRKIVGEGFSLIHTKK